MRIVVVEDGAKIRRGIINLIQKIDPQYQVVGEAANGMDGLAIISAARPDLVIADIRMPELNGLEMLEALKQAGFKHKTVILSAYSDFSFAQQAITLGVSEYLLKPVTAQKLEKTLLAIAGQLAEESRRDQSSRLVTVKQQFQDLLMGKTGRIKTLRQCLDQESGFGGDSPFALLGAFTGTKIYDLEALQQVLNQTLADDPEFRFLVMDPEIAGLTLAIVACPSDFGKVVTFLETRLLDQVQRHDFPNLVMGWVAVAAPEEIHNKLQRLREIFKWALLFGKDEMISEAKVAQLRPSSPFFPDELEKKAIAAVAHRNYDGLREAGQEFGHWWQKEIYPPEQIIAGFIRFISAVANAVKESDADLFKQLRQQEILQRVLDAVTMDQLEAALREMLHRLSGPGQAKGSSYGLIIGKALKFIAAQYQEGITREEIATRLHITPEYLSMLFYKEVGQSFTAYLKNQRINKAKELLTTTDLKIYEVAERVGYPDPKYFCRVFKEVTGTPAGEFQKKF